MSTADNQMNQNIKDLEKIQNLQKTQKMQFNDTVKVVLTSTGANILNTLNRRSNQGFLLRSTARLRTDYKQGESYTNELHHLMSIFIDGYADGSSGIESPFVDMELT